VDLEKLKYNILQLYSQLHKKKQLGYLIRFPLVGPA
jgi:hypothetical protein